MLLLALTAASRAELGCPMGEVLAALGGRAAAPHPAVLTPPPQLAEPPEAAPPGATKAVYGTHYRYYQDTDNFTINWSQAWIDPAIAASAGEALEAAWTAYIEDDGWPQPVSSDRYLIWVVFDPGLGSTTGLTTLYRTSRYPGGYPVILMNPDYAWDDAFWRSLAAHEFHHTVQYGMREDSGDPEESWYWEASAQWSIERVLPDLDVYARESVRYSWHPWDRYSSTEDLHQYGMFLLNAWMEQALSPEAMRLAWEAGGAMPGQLWDEVLAESTGLEPAAIWAGFTAAVANNNLEESALYLDVLVDGPLADGQEGELAYLGTRYFRAGAAATVSVSGGGALLSAPGGYGETIQVAAGEIVGVTGLVDPLADYRLSLGPPAAGDTGETGAPAGSDTAAPTDTAGAPAGSDTAADTAAASQADTAEAPVPGAADSAAATSPGDEPAGGCGCAATDTPPPPLLLAALLGLLTARRRS